MHRRLWNTFKLTFELEPRAPLLVKSGMLSPNPALPDMQFVRTQTPEGEKLFIPGSSLKGTFRSFTEKVLRTANGRWACDPFSDSACGRQLRSEEDTTAVYRRSCNACKIYGNTRLRGRLSFTDALPEGEVVTETRYGVAISRLTNAAVGPFDIEVLVQGRFAGALVLQNFEVWQLGLLTLTLQAINDGLVRIGFGKNRGFGEVRIRPTQIIVEQAKHAGLGAGDLWGVGAFVQEEERRAYGLRQDDRLTGLPSAEEQDLVLYVRRTYSTEQWDAIARKTIEGLSLLEESA
ncbi:protein of unknown function DUF324 [Rhodothermus marinus SG0.5JP17-172]|jgi:CRISPR-associated RAMP protein (TIGR02581 family)|uniref:RAMP superfamily CRISPR-associated protein n=1 Tax=Rhodothermus marinus TaxID=29549 RepID=UPI000223DB4B|nr:RAMP superfamily CRISPR-associated protein [Rhodothermus marinus]AEN73085.1 protein of unknown function DUF324 [Rhodothermus marinus SG0.5JP17-172]